METVGSSKLGPFEKFARSYVELAAMLGCNRKTVQRLGKDPDAPVPRSDGRHDVEAWREYFARKGISPRRQKGVVEEYASATEAKIRNVLLQNQKLEFQLSVLRKEYVPSTEVEKWGAALGAAIRKVVCQIHLIAPSVVGVSVADAEALLKEMEGEILQQLHTLDEAKAAWRPENEPAA